MANEGGRKYSKNHRFFNAVLYCQGMRLIRKSLGFWARKVFHVGLNGCIAAAVLFLPAIAIPPLTVIGFVIVLVFESLRLKTRAKAFVQETVGPLFKAEEAVEFSGLFWAAIGALLIAQFAENAAYSFGFAILAVSDAGAAIVGKWSGVKPFYMNKSWPGSLACFLLAFLVAFFYAVFWLVSMPAFLFAIIVAAAVTAIEIFSYPFDDNFLIPIVSSYLFHLALTWV